jgi:hypothetical protein
MKTNKQNQRRQKRAKRAATGAHLGEMILIECSILENAMEASRIMGRLQKCAAHLKELRAQMQTYE